MADLQLIEHLASRLAQSRNSGQQAEVGDLPLPDYDDALAIQQRILPHTGGVAGFKVGRSGAGRPNLAPLSAARTFASGAEIPMRDILGIELEIGFEVLQQPCPDMRLKPQEFFRPRIVLELCDQRLKGDDLAPTLKLADMLLNEGLVIGPALTDWDGRDFGTMTARLQCGATTVVDGPVQIPGGSALENLWALLDNLGDHCGGIAVGHIVITGSVSGLTWFPTGTDITGHIAGFGDVTCRLAPQT